MREQFFYIGVPVVIMGYMGERIFIRRAKGGKPFWVGMEYVK